MPMTPAQDQRFRELANQHAAVSAQILLTGEVSLIARDTAGRVQAVEVLSTAGHPMGAESVANVLGTHRTLSLRSADQALDALVAHLALQQAAGTEPNISAVASAAAVSRTTLYSRLAAELRKAER